MARRNARRRPTRKPRSSSRRKSLPAWLWFGAGLGCCLLGITLYQLATQPSPPAPSSTHPAASPQATADKGLTFKFYDTLRQFSVKVDPSEDKAPHSSPAAKKTAPRDSHERADATSARAQAQHSYFLQAGSFKQRDQAEKRRIELLLLNTDASITRVSHNGTAWYRVRTGPYGSEQKVASIRTKLLNEGIDTLVTRR